MRTLEQSRRYRGMIKLDECIKCGSDENLEVHHVDGNSLNNIPANLVALCHSCHLRQHGIREKRKYPGKYARGTKHNRRKK